MNARGLVQKGERGFEPDGKTRGCRGGLIFTLQILETGIGAFIFRLLMAEAHTCSAAEELPSDICADTAAGFGMIRPAPVSIGRIDRQGDLIIGKRSHRLP